MKMFSKFIALALCLSLAASLLWVAPVSAATAEAPNFLAGDYVGYFRGNESVNDAYTSVTSAKLSVTKPSGKVIQYYSGQATAVQADGSRRFYSRAGSGTNDNQKKSFYASIDNVGIMNGMFTTTEVFLYEKFQTIANNSFVVEFDIKPKGLKSFSLTGNATGSGANSMNIYSSSASDVVDASDFIHFVLLWNNDDYTWSVWKDGVFVKTVSETVADSKTNGNKTEEALYCARQIRLVAGVDKDAVTTDEGAFYDIKNIIVRKATLKTKYEVPTITTGETLLTMGYTVSKTNDNTYNVSTNVDKNYIIAYGSGVEAKTEGTDTYIHMEMRTTQSNSRFQLYWKSIVGDNMGWDEKYNTTSDFVYEFDVRANNKNEKKQFSISDFENSYIPASTYYSANVWNHVKIAYDCSEKTFYTYVNGVLVNVNSSVTLERTNKEDEKEIYLLNDFRIQITHDNVEAYDGSYIDLKNFSLSKAEITFEEPALSVSKVNLAKKKIGNLFVACDKHGYVPDNSPEGTVSLYTDAQCGDGAPTYSMQAQVTYSNPTSEDKYGYVYLVKYDVSSDTVPAAVYAQKVTFTAGATNATVTTSFENSGFDHETDASGELRHKFTHLRAFVADENGNMIPLAAPAVTTTGATKGITWTDNSKVTVID